MQARTALALTLTPLATMALVALHACADDDADQRPGEGGSGAATSSNDASVDRDADDPILPAAPGCELPPGGSSGPVQAPVLRTTLPASWDENWFASPAIVDVDGDGALDIVAARHSVLYAWSGDGSPLWQTAFGQSASSSSEHGSSRMWASPVAGDLDGDGQIEIAVGSDADGQGINLALYDHQGELEPGWPQVFGSSEVRSLAGGDIDGDGIVELLVNKTSEGPTTAVYELDGGLHPGWPQVDHASCDPPEPAEPCWDFGGYNQNIATGDVDGDGVLDVVSSYDAIGFGIFHGDGSPFPTDESFADRVVTAVEAYHELALSQQGWGNGDRSEFTYSPPIVADVDENGDLEIVLVGDHEHSESTDNQGVTLWVLNPDMTRPAGWDPPKDTGMPLEHGELGQNIVPTHPSPSVGNLDGQPGLEIVFPAYDGKLYAFGADGAVQWSFTVTSSGSPYLGISEALIVDLNRDAIPEVVFCTYSSGAPREPETPAHLIVLSAAGAELARVELFGRGTMAAPSVADLDGDGELELVVSLKDTVGGGQGGVQIFDLPGSAPGCVLWGTGRGNLLRQGYVPAL